MKIAIVGAGAVGTALSRVLCNNPLVAAVSVIDKNGTVLEPLKQSIQSKKLRTFRLGVEKEQALATIIKGFDFLISALPSEYNLQLCRLAIENGINYIDFGGDDSVYEEQLAYNDRALEQEVLAIPNCGMAPGLINIIAMSAYEEFDSVESIHMRATGLPMNPIPPLNYQLSFSPAGLINEYLNDVHIIQNSKAIKVKALEGYETLSFYSEPNLSDLEAFYTSGHITTLAKELDGKVKELDFKTIRYKGHRDIMKALFELGFDSNGIIDIRSNLTFKELLIRQLNKKLPRGHEDIVLAKTVVNGVIDGVQRVRDYEIVHRYHQTYDLPAMMACTTIPVEIVTELVFEGKVTRSGGVSAPELVVNKPEFMERLSDKGIEISVNEHALNETADAP